VQSKGLNAYLEGVQHPKHEILKNLKVVRLKMPWRTTMNVTYYGIFCMRHIESYFGEGEKWQS